MNLNKLSHILEKILVLTNLIFYLIIFYFIISTQKKIYKKKDRNNLDLSKIFPGAREFPSLKKF